MNELRDEALRMVAELTGDSIGYTKMQIGTCGDFVTLETAAVSMAERALKAEAANREQKATLADRDNHIDLAYKALGDVNRSVYLFDHIREQKAEIERLTKEVQSALSSLAELPRIIAEINQSHATELASLRASVGEKWIAYSESKPAYRETVEVLFSGPEIALCRREQEELAEDDMREPEDILWDINGDQDRSVMGIFWRKFAPPTLPGEET